MSTPTNELASPIFPTGTRRNSLGTGGQRRGSHVRPSAAGGFLMGRKRLGIGAGAGAGGGTAATARGRASVTVHDRSWVGPGRSHFGQRSHSRAFLGGGASSMTSSGPGGSVVSGVAAGGRPTRNASSRLRQRALPKHSDGHAVTVIGGGLDYIDQPSFASGEVRYDLSLFVLVFMMWLLVGCTAA